MFGKQDLFLLSSEHCLIFNVFLSACRCHSVDHHSTREIAAATITGPSKRVKGVNVEYSVELKCCVVPNLVLMDETDAVVSVDGLLLIPSGMWMLWKIFFGELLLSVGEKYGNSPPSMP